MVGRLGFGIRVGGGGWGGVMGVVWVRADRGARLRGCGWGKGGES